MSLEERVEILEGKVSDIETRINPLPNILNNFDERITALEKEPKKKVLKMGKFNYDGEGELIEISAENMAFNYGEHSLGCIINDYDPNTDGTILVFKYVQEGTEKSTEVNIKQEGDKGRAYLPITWVSSNQSSFSAILKKTGTTSETKQITFNPAPVGTRTLHFGRTNYDSREGWVEGKSKIEVTGGIHSAALWIENYDPSNDNKNAVFEYSVDGTNWVAPMSREILSDSSNRYMAIKKIDLIESSANGKGRWTFMGKQIEFNIIFNPQGNKLAIGRLKYDGTGELE